MGFPTEQEVYHRLRWDPRFDVQRCSITIRLRPTGTRRVPYLELDVAVVPWHLVVEFWLDDELIWSRPARIDRLDEIAARAERAARSAGTPLTGWRGDALEPVTRAQLRVVTWNLLFDRYEAERLCSAERWQDALDRLAALDADVIVLVEITAAMHRIVLAQPWVQRYAATHAADDDLAPYGQTILSRLPMRDARSVPLDRGKRATLATVEHAGRTVGIAAIHLTSNRKPDALVVRRAQLASLVAVIDETPRDAWIVAGDFNGPPDELALPALADVWESLHPGEPGHTFDVARNELAAAATTTGRSARMDRIHVRGLRALHCTLVGEARGPCGLPPSDHYGVVADLAVAHDLATAATSPRLALAIVPPLEAWGPLQRVRCAEDRNWQKWPPHVTLFLPFVAAPYQDDAIAAIEAVTAVTAPFEIELDRLEMFDERIVVLAPRNARPLLALHAALEAALPALARDRSFRPHLTIGRHGTRVALTARWWVDRICILQRTDEVARFETVAELALGRRATRRFELEPPPPPHAAIVDRVRSLVEVPVLPFGSMVYAPEHARDLDLLVRGDQQHVEALAHGLALAPAGSGRLRGTVDGVDVDILVTDDARLLASASDAAVLRDHLRAHGRHEAFAAAWPDVRRFAMARGLLHNGLGYFGSFGWALLLAVPLMHDEALCAVSAADAFAAWLGWVAKLRPHARIGLDEIRDDDPSQLHLAAPSPPSRDIARHLTPGTARTLFAELRHPRTADLLDEPPPGTTLVVRGADRASRGRYEGQALSLIRELEKRVGTVRVWGRFDSEGTAWSHRFTVGDRDADVALELVASWLAAAGLDGVTAS